MDHRPHAGIRDKPLSTLLSREIDGPNRAEIDADPAPLARNPIDYEPLADCSEPTELPAPSTAGAAFGINYRLPAAKKISAFPDLGLEQKVQVGSIDIGVA
jgi:hypothetical protein